MKEYKVGDRVTFRYGGIEKSKIYAITSDSKYLVRIPLMLSSYEVLIDKWDIIEFKEGSEKQSESIVPEIVAIVILLVTLYWLFNGNL